MVLLEFNSVSFINLAQDATPEIIQEGWELTRNLKAGRVNVLDQVVTQPIHNFLLTEVGTNSLLVPIPRSAPLLPNAVWPSKLLCDKLLNKGIGVQIECLLERQEAVAIAHFNNNANQRATIDEHYRTISVNNPPLIVPNKIVLVDDVITQGRTAVACYRRLKEAYPNADISIFTPVIRKRYVKVTSLLQPNVSKVQYFDSGKSMVV